MTDGKADEAKGRAKEAVGDLTDDEDLKREGKLDRAAASAKDQVSKAKEKAGETIDKAKDKAKKIAGKDGSGS